MYLENSFRGYRNNEQVCYRANYLILLTQKSNWENSPIRAIVRKVALQQFGQFMMGRARINNETIIISGGYGSDGLPCSVSDNVYSAGILLPTDIYNAWNQSKDAIVRDWAIANLYNLVSKRQKMKA